MKPVKLEKAVFNKKSKSVGILYKVRIWSTKQMKYFQRRLKKGKKMFALLKFYLTMPIIEVEQ